ncbi:MAG: amidohydrolase family protein [Deltaproteobacteria bacterium]|nr:amidohydrolase family protein [Deltaproteobacteria bacterium]
MPLLRPALVPIALAALTLVACGGGAQGVQGEVDAGEDAGTDAGTDAGSGNTGDAGPCPTDPPPDALGDAVVTPGESNRYLLKGRVATPDSLFEPGQVLVVNDKIACVGVDCSSDANAAGATIIDTKGVIFPGLVDAHNHTQYDYLPPYTPTPPMLFQNRGQWAARSDYSAWTASVNDNEGTYVCEQVKYGELRALMGGTTTIEGSYNIALKCFRTLVHNAEYGNELGTSKMRTNIPGVDSVTSDYATTLRNGMLDGSITAYVIHLAEGVDAKSKNEFATLVSKGLLLPPTVIIHGTALTQTEFAQMAQAGAKLIWSPDSNLILYGATTDVRTAMAAGVSVSIAPDWTLSGSGTVLAELKVARQVSCTQWDGLLDAKTLVKMATSNPADALALGQYIGRIQPGLLADLLVIADRGQETYRTLVEARPQDVRLVMIAGNLRYGDSALIAATGRAPCDALQMCGVEKRICVADSTDATDKLNEGLIQIVQAVSGFYTNPYRFDLCP